jgi:hypothetical protein
MHDFVRQLQLPTLLQYAANHSSALLQERHAHVLQDKVVASLKPPNCLKR